jgi:putative Ca2+/H+ antiporter (TMEM165/GDT1 family)
MNWNVLFSTFGLIFVAELGDKTQLAVVTQTCKFRQPWSVFLGASLALTGVTVLGAIGGRWLGALVPASVLQFAAALAFVVMGIFIGREAARATSGGVERNAASEPGSDENDQDATGVDCSPIATWDWRAFSSTLGLLFVAELGDKTQLAVLSLAGKHEDTWSVFLGGTLALIFVTALGVLGGQGLCKLIPERLLLWISAVAFVAMGVLIGFGVL